MSYLSLEASALPKLTVFLTRLVQNLTLRNDCNLIPSAHGTQRVVLSKRSLDMVDNPQLSPQVVGSWPDSNRKPFTRKMGVLTSRPQGTGQSPCYTNTVLELGLTKRHCKANPSTAGLYHFRMLRSKSIRFCYTSHTAAQRS